MAEPAPDVETLQVDACPGCRRFKTAGRPCSACDAPAGGAKHDQDKPRFDLLPHAAVARLVDVLTFGARKYAPDNWRRVGDARRRYYAAALRHLWAWWRGERADPESALPHLAHALCCVAFLLELEESGGSGE